MGIGAVNLLITHSSFIMKREKGQWPFSAWLLGVMIVFTVVGLWLGTSSSQYQFLFQNFYYPNDTTIYSLIGWMVVYAIYLTFRAKTYETTYMLVLAFLALLGNSPIGPALLPPLTDLQSWLSSVPNTAAVRGFYMAMSIGAIVVGLRTLMGRERAALGG
jgi:cell division protein FtsW (lipid II flippase)